MNELLNVIRNAVRRVMRQIARAIDSVSGGRITPNMVTFTGLFMHVPIAVLIAQGYFIYAAVLLIIFGLFDTLDGELARLQNRANSAGMFLDSVTDRMKEVIIYSGLVMHLVSSALNVRCNYITENCLVVERLSIDYFPAIAVGVLGGSLLTSYINAWGEAVLSRSGAKRSSMNKAFRGGIASFEVRIFLLIVGLLTGLILPILLVLAVLIIITIITRMHKVFRELSRV